MPKIDGGSCDTTIAVTPSVVGELADQAIDAARADRIEAGRRLVEQHDLGIERERARDRGALAHAVGELGRDSGRRSSAM